MSTDTFESAIEWDPDPDITGAQSIHQRLITDGFVPSPICVISAVDNGERRAEVFEEATTSPGVPPRFMVRLVIPGECEHLLILNDLPELIGHFDRVTSLFAPLVQPGTTIQSKRQRTAATPRARPKSRQ